MQDIFILPPMFKIRDHAVQRFLERIICKESYTQDEEEIAAEIIRNILTNRVLKQRKLNQDQMQLTYRNAVFVYGNDTNHIITVYPNKSKCSKNVEWVYIFPAPLRFKKGVPTDQIPKLITYGFVPIRKQERFIIGQSGQQLYQYDPKYNIISPLVAKQNSSE